jgi:hypothetical protein
VVLVGFGLPDPAAASAAERLRPRGLLPAGGAPGGLVLRDVRILVSPQTLQQHLAFFAPGAHDASGAGNATFAYTVRWGYRCRAPHGA